MSACAALLGPGAKKVGSAERRGNGGLPTLPKAPLPTLRRRTKWKRFTSPSKSMGWRSQRVLALETGKWTGRYTSGRQQTPPMCLYVRDYKMILGDD